MEAHEIDKVEEATSVDKDEHDGIETNKPEKGANYLSTALDLLQKGEWKPVIQNALDHLIAGEDTAKWILFYSGLSSLMPKKLHVFIMGNSQNGKSFLQSQVGKLFDGYFEDVSDMSSKSLYYETKSKNDRKLYRGKILFLDEFNDMSDAAKDFTKKVTSAGKEKLTLKTVVDKNYMEVEIGAIPVIWTNSMEKIDDIGDQILNRFFPLNINEELSQSQIIEDYQKRKEFFGCLDDRAEYRILMAQAIIHNIRCETDFEVLNLFSTHLSQSDYSRRNIRPKFESLLSSIVYANRHRRLSIEKNDRKFIFATLSDNSEALKLWKENERFLRYSLPDRYLKLLAVFNEDTWRSKDEMAQGYFKFHGTPLTDESAGTYANELEKQGILVSRYREGQKFKEWSRSNDSNNSVLELDMIDEQSLDDAIMSFVNSGLIQSAIVKDAPLNPELTALDHQTIKAHIFDAPLPEKAKREQSTLIVDYNKPERKAQLDTIQFIMKMVSEGQYNEKSFECFEDEWPGIGVTLRELTKRGELSVRPDGTLENYGRR